MVQQVRGRQHVHVQDMPKNMQEKQLRFEFEDV